ncbi:hypothetical protein TorRG33x02_203950 [Trema orientale]|uniref:Uncharacterized protein n=1 Tax=Trema orientale TaxID=63057 RepID=A0A2P5EE83_TREOI|nr:hypothetical protein TorRG33x02_203950 [Trema orientale]
MDDDNNATNAINDNQIFLTIPLEPNLPSLSSPMPLSALSSTNLKPEEKPRRPLPLWKILLNCIGGWGGCGSVALSALCKDVAALVKTGSPSPPLG